MLNKIIYDYEEFEKKLNEIIENSLKNSYKIEKENNNWHTSCNLPINHYIVGNGNKHIVLLGSFHGSEIITSEFLLYVLNEIVENEKQFENILKEYTLDFIPIVNPEGYIITTSILRKYISRETSLTELQKKCIIYQTAYNQDDIEEDRLLSQGLESNHILMKHYQNLFKNCTWKDIPDKYNNIKEKLKSLYYKYNIPDGAIIEWSANANGIDLNANIKYNKNLTNIQNGLTLYLPYRHSNIIYSDPGPINCPFDKNQGYLDELENKYISDFLENLNNEKKLVAIFNYHSTGALIDQRPSEIPEDLKDRNINIKLKSLNNYLFAKIYQSETYNSSYNRKIRYSILKKKSELCTRNDYFRVLYPLGLLIELSPIKGNPIGPYCNLDINYKSIMKSNLNAILKSIQNLNLSNRITNDLYSWMENNVVYRTDEEFIKKGYFIIDEIYKKYEEVFFS